MSKHTAIENEGVSQELRKQLPGELSVDFEKMFPKLTGFGVAKANKRRITILKTCAPLLRNVLEQGETVLYISRGVVNDLVEQYFMGIVAMYINQSVIVATDRRYLFIRCDRKNRPRQFVNEAPYEAITSMKPGGFLTSFVIRWKKGCIALANLGKQDGKLLKEYRIEAMSQLPQSTVVRNTAQMNYLCPACYTPVERMVDQCPRCTAYFKSPRIAALRSLILPGLGDLYLGHTVFAIIEMIWALAVLSMLILLITASRSIEDLVISLVVFMAFVGLNHGVDALLTKRMAKKGLIADSGKLATRDW